MSDSRFVIAVFTPDSSLLTQCIGFNNNSSIAIITLLTASRHNVSRQLKRNIGIRYDTTCKKGITTLRSLEP